MNSIPQHFNKGEKNMCRVFLDENYTLGDTVMRCARCVGCGNCPNRARAKAIVSVQQETETILED